MTRWAKLSGISFGVAFACWALAYQTTEFLLVSVLYLLVRQEMDGRSLEEIEGRVHEVTRQTRQSVSELRKEVVDVRDMALRDLGVGE